MKPYTTTIPLSSMVPTAGDEMFAGLKESMEALYWWFINGFPLTSS